MQSNAPTSIPTCPRQPVYHRYRLDVRLLGRTVTTAPHPFVADFDGNGISNVQDILTANPTYPKPWGGIEQLAWSPVSDKVAYVCRKRRDWPMPSPPIPISILATVGNGKHHRREQRVRYQSPISRPDGKYIAWQSMERDGYEADLNRLFVMNLQPERKGFVSRAFESNVDAFLWNNTRKAYTSSAYGT